MDEAFTYIRRIVPATETEIFISASVTPANALVQRDGTGIVQRDGTIIENRRP